MSLTDIQLKHLSKAMNFPLEDILFKDDMPKKFQFNKSYIINMQDEKDEDGNNNGGSHWVCLQINKYPNDKIQGMYFDPYGMGYPKDVENCIIRTINKKIPFTTKDVQSVVNNACGYWCSAYLHFINSFEGRSKDLYQDTSSFLDLFDDLNHSIDFKKNEYILKHFFQSNDKLKRVPINVDSIIDDDVGNGIDIVKIPVEIKLK